VSSELWTAGSGAGGGDRGLWAESSSRMAPIDTEGRKRGRQNGAVDVAEGRRERTAVGASMLEQKASNVTKGESWV
jgi:hypothetical protein